MSRMYAASGVIGASIFGILSAFAAFQPELKKQAEIREGTFQEQHDDRPKPNDRALSDAMAQDFKEAGDEIKRSGFGWGFRALLSGQNPMATIDKQGALAERKKALEEQRLMETIEKEKADDLLEQQKVVETSEKKKADDMLEQRENNILARRREG